MVSGWKYDGFTVFQICFRVPFIVFPGVVLVRSRSTWPILVWDPLSIGANFQACDDSNFKLWLKWLEAIRPHQFVRVFGHAELQSDLAAFAKVHGLFRAASGLDVTCNLLWGMVPCDQPSKFQRLQQVSQVDLFISHSSRCSSWLKLLTIDHYLNLDLAIFCSSLWFILTIIVLVAAAGSFSAVAQHQDILFRCFFVWPLLVFVSIYLGGHLFSRRSFWFDQVCIDQRNLLLRCQALKAVPAFVANATGLVVLYDDTYFAPGGGRCHGLAWLRGKWPDIRLLDSEWQIPPRSASTVTWMAFDSGEGFCWCCLQDERLWHCLEEAGAECRSHFQAMRQRVSLVVCSEPWKGLGPWKVVGIGSFPNQILWVPGQFCGSWGLMAWGADCRFPFYSVGALFPRVMIMAGFTSWLFLLQIWCIFVPRRAGEPMTGTRACLFWLSYRWWVNVILAWLFWPTVAVAMFTEEPGQCQTSLDSFALAAMNVTVIALSGESHPCWGFMYRLAVSFLRQWKYRVSLRQCIEVQDGGFWWCFVQMVFSWRLNYQSHSGLEQVDVLPQQQQHDTYFERLWCIYELAVHSRGQSPHSATELIPTWWPIWTIFFIGMFALGVFFTEPAVAPKWDATSGSALFMSVLETKFYSVYMYPFMGSCVGWFCFEKLQRRRAMLDQLLQFDLRNAKCALETDRRVIEEQVLSLFDEACEPPVSVAFGTENTEPEEDFLLETIPDTIRHITSYPTYDAIIDQFNGYVRGPLRDKVIKSMGKEDYISFKICIVPALPWFFYSMTYVLGCDGTVDCQTSASRGGFASVAQYMTSNAFFYYFLAPFGQALEFPALLIACSYATEFVSHAASRMALCCCLASFLLYLGDNLILIQRALLVCTMVQFSPLWLASFIASMLLELLGWYVFFKKHVAPSQRRLLRWKQRFEGWEKTSRL